MSQNLSAAAIASINAQEAEEIFLETIVIEHENLEAPLRFVNNTQDLMIGAHLYLAAGFTYTPPQQGDGAARTARLSICNVDRAIMPTIRALTTSPTLTIALIRASDPEDTELGPFTFVLSSVPYDARTISGELIDDIGGSLSCPVVRYNQQDFPGLY